MTISVKLFASLREQVPNAAREVAGDDVRTVADVWHAATGGDVPLPEHVLCSVNLDHRGANDPVHDGDEVAFFPPVTGG